VIWELELDVVLWGQSCGSDKVNHTDEGIVDISDKRTVGEIFEYYSSIINKYGIISYESMEININASGVVLNK